MPARDGIDAVRRQYLRQQLRSLPVEIIRAVAQKDLLGGVDLAGRLDDREQYGAGGRARLCR